MAKHRDDCTSHQEAKEASEAKAAALGMAIEALEVEVERLRLEAPLHDRQNEVDEVVSTAKSHEAEVKQRISTLEVALAAASSNAVALSAL
ncbi:hypothetical protein AC578_1668 [Pseudocercospora eumusae]|uniref:Uncharacterized protein n=1 Tax=Pseudocercospora eumusae TaxID=321146 RepID=A0A139GXG2_9PEZI|nr:hypothetical protein AC578_1668 [Pseudocercospora eumusae]